MLVARAGLPRFWRWASREPQFIHEPGGERVFDPEPLLRSRGAEGDEQMRLSGAGVTDEAERLPAPDPIAGGEGVDGGGVDVRVRVKVEIAEPLVPREPGRLDAPDGRAPVAVVALRQQQLREEPLVAELLLVRGGCGLIDDGADCGEMLFVSP